MDQGTVGAQEKGLEEGFNAVKAGAFGLVGLWCAGCGRELPDDASIDAHLCSHCSPTVAEFSDLKINVLGLRETSRR